MVAMAIIQWVAVAMAILQWVAMANAYTSDMTNNFLVMCASTKTPLASTLHPKARPSNQKHQPMEGNIDYHPVL